MIPHLSDTNILLRYNRTHDPRHEVVRRAIDRLQESASPLYITPQNLVEYWNVATRPTAQNGFGLTPAQADLEIQGIKRLFHLLPDIPTIHAEWRQLVVSCGVSRKQVHDARLAAVMKAHGVARLLTFNVSVFTRYPGITAVHP